jgi:tryptophan synthase alpha chain
MTRIDDTFARLRAERRKAFVAYVMAGDPDFDTSREIVLGLPAAGVDVIELGLPFTDPMADGPTIQLAGQRALAAGQTLDRTLDLARALRATGDQTPLVLMGYYNPIHHRGVDTFLRQAGEAGIDGLIVVDLPPEEDEELCLPGPGRGPQLHPPRHPHDRRPPPAQGAPEHLRLRLLRVDHRHHRRRRRRGRRRRPEVARIKAQTDLPVIVGFGIRTPESAREIAAIADGAVVGSAIVSEIAQGRSPAEVLAFVRSLADGAHAA